MASFIELTDAKHGSRILVNIEEITFIHPVESKKGNATHIHFTSSTYSEDRSIRASEDYETVKQLLNKAKSILN